MKLFILVFVLVLTASCQKMQKSEDPLGGIAASKIDGLEITNRKADEITLKWSCNDGDKVFIDLLREFPGEINNEAAPSGLESFAVVARADCNKESITDTFMIEGHKSYTYVLRFGSSMNSEHTSPIVVGPYAIPTTDILNVNANGGNVELDWAFGGAGSFTSYIYRDGVYLTSTDTLSYTDGAASVGYHTYRIEICPTTAIRGSEECFQTNTADIDLASATVGAITGFSAQEYEGNILLRWNYSGEANFYLSMSVSGSGVSVDVPKYKTFSSSNDEIRNGDSYAYLLPLDQVYNEYGRQYYTFTFGLYPNNRGTVGSTVTTSVTLSPSALALNAQPIVVDHWVSEFGDRVPHLAMSGNPGPYTSYTVERCQATDPSAACSEMNCSGMTTMWDESYIAAIPFFQEYTGNHHTDLQVVYGNSYCYRFTVRNSEDSDISWTAMPILMTEP